MVTFPMVLTNPNPVFKVTAFLRSNISKTVHLTNKTQTIPDMWMVPCLLTSTDL